MGSGRIGMCGCWRSSKGLGGGGGVRDGEGDKEEQVSMDG